MNPKDCSPSVHSYLQDLATKSDSNCRGILGITPPIILLDDIPRSWASSMSRLFGSSPLIIEDDVEYRLSQRELLDKLEVLDINLLSKEEILVWDSIPRCFLPYQDTFVGPKSEAHYVGMDLCPKRDTKYRKGVSSRPKKSPSRSKMQKQSRKRNR